MTPKELVEWGINHGLVHRVRVGPPGALPSTERKTSIKRGKIMRAIRSAIWKTHGKPFNVLELACGVPQEQARGACRILNASGELKQLKRGIGSRSRVELTIYAATKTLRMPEDTGKKFLTKERVVL